MTLQCHHCGWEWTRTRLPGRNETCERCGADLKVCLNCVHYDSGAAYQCRERRAEPVAEKDRANYCEWFQFAARVYSPDRQEQRRADSAREQLKRLLGD